MTRKEEMKGLECIYITELMNSSLDKFYENSRALYVPQP
jgi:hypothetical protein